MVRVENMKEEDKAAIKEELKEDVQVPAKIGKHRPGFLEIGTDLKRACVRYLKRIGWGIKSYRLSAWRYQAASFRRALVSNDGDKRFSGGIRFYDPREDN